MRYYSVLSHLFNPCNQFDIYHGFILFCVVSDAAFNSLRRLPSLYPSLFEMLKRMKNFISIINESFKLYFVCCGTATGKIHH